MHKRPLHREVLCLPRVQQKDRPPARAHSLTTGDSGHRDHGGTHSCRSSCSDGRKFLPPFLRQAAGMIILFKSGCKN